MKHVYTTTDGKTKIKVEVKDDLIWIHTFSDGEFKPTVIISESMCIAQGGDEKFEHYEV